MLGLNAAEARELIDRVLRVSGDRRANYSQEAAELAELESQLPPWDKAWDEADKYEAA